MSMLIIEKVNFSLHILLPGPINFKKVWLFFSNPSFDELDDSHHELFLRSILMVLGKNQACDFIAEHVLAVPDIFLLYEANVM